MGKVLIDYRSSGSDWTLSISDNGIGMAAGDHAPKAGLGTGIVEALVKNLKGEITVSDAGPGTIVSICRQEAGGVRTDVSTAA